MRKIIAIIALSFFSLLIMSESSDSKCLCKLSHKTIIKLHASNIISDDNLNWKDDGFFIKI